MQDGPVVNNLEMKDQDYINETLKPMENTMSDINEVPVTEPTQNLLGVEETTNVFKFVASLGVAIAKSLEDKKITLSDALNFIAPAKTFFPALTGFSKLKAELMDQITPEELKQIQDAVASELPQGATEEMINEALSIALQIKNFSVKYF